ncbi:MAG: 23S rRNA (adenine(2503)-C(2))-methyltransferase RlmN [Deltaproteobacteria bacterium]|nr:23S rRNA (adenine(2503)-C(2))-methyltransferase RlmN [Deltaproteobacteria bacterium]
MVQIGQVPKAVAKDDRVELMGMSMEDLRTFAVDVLEEKPFRGKQLFKWIYGKLETDFDVMTDMSKPVRAKLKAIAKISRLAPAEVHRSTDGTIKFLWELRDGLKVESVLIPEVKRLTLCISSQVGCAMGCDFCVTAKGGFTRNLDKSEILGQIVQAQTYAADERRISNIVLMGMGEPLLNLDNVIESMETAQESDGLGLSHRKITLSTIGLIPQLEELGKRSRINLAVSLHGTTNENRSAIMPINDKYDIEQLVAALKRFPLPTRKMITIEYILLRDINDDVADAHRLAKLLRGMKAKVNLIPYNDNPFTEYRRPRDKDILAYQETLMSYGIHTVTRLNRGGDIAAACGQLGGYKQQHPRKRTKGASAPPEETA